MRHGSVSGSDAIGPEFELNHARHYNVVMMSEICRLRCYANDESYKAPVTSEKTGFPLKKCVTA